MKIQKLLLCVFFYLFTVTSNAFANNAQVSASAFQDGNPPAAAIDGDPATRWSAQGNGQWVRLNFEKIINADAVEIAFANGDRRNTFFTLETSDDGSTWRTIFEGESSGKSTNFERFAFSPQQVCSVRYTGYGNSDNDWNSVAEIRVIPVDDKACLLAAVTLAPLFGDHAVLQRHVPVPVWGDAPPGEEITVSFRDHEHRAIADSQGRWSVTLPPMEAGAPGKLVARGKSGEARATDILIGEVWLCSGQSNMAFRLDETGDRDEIARAQHPDIRHFFVPQTVSLEPARHVKGSWTVCTPETAGKFTATGYFFAVEIQARLGVPVGLINSSVGGTQIESWMSAKTLASDPAFAIVRERWANVIAGYPKARADFEAAYGWWHNANGKERLEAAKLGKRKPLPPQRPRHRNAPSSLYNGMIDPLAPCAIAGVLWDQGGANATRANEYAALFKAHITGWRTRWMQPEMPFYFVQNPNYRDPQSPGDNRAKLREAQAAALSLPHTGMAVAIDIGEPDNVHPRNKRDLGKRLALIARAKTYGETALVCGGPVFINAEREGKNVRVRFKTSGQKLISRSPASVLNGFELAGNDGKFHATAAQIENDCVILTSPSVKSPAFVRYAWGDDPACDLANDTGLPAAPFRARIK